MYYVFNLFFIFSFLGFVLEQLSMNLLKKPYNSSLLYGPCTPVYGISFFVIYGINKLLDYLNIKVIKKLILFFILSFIFMSLLEFITGELIFITTGIVYWDYSNIPLNFGKYVCVPISLIWSIYSILINYLIFPFINKYIKKLPKLLTLIFLCLFFIDVIYSVFK
ncbi:MAG: putative ABC transporter permease [Bacilli bacterium]